MAATPLMLSCVCYYVLQNVHPFNIFATLTWCAWSNVPPSGSLSASWHSQIRPPALVQSIPSCGMVAVPLHVQLPATFSVEKGFNCMVQAVQLMPNLSYCTHKHGIWTKLLLAECHYRSTYLSRHNQHQALFNCKLCSHRYTWQRQVQWKM